MFGAANAVLMIAGAKSSLIVCDINHVLNLAQCGACVKPTLKYKEISVNNLNGFHILQVRFAIIICAKRILTLLFLGI